MIVRGIDVGYVLRQAPRGDFFDEKKGMLSRLARSGEGTFVTPPVTLEVRPWDYVHKVYSWRGIIRRTADFSSPGVLVLLNEGKWQKRTRPFILSFAPICVTPPTRKKETQDFVEYLEKCLQDFQAPLCVALNICVTANGNGKKKMPGELIQEIEELFACFENLAIPVLVQADPLFCFVVAKAISKHPVCHGFIVSNPIPWRMFPDYLIPVDGRKRKLVLFARSFFGKQTLLEKVGGGVIAGAALTPFVAEWLRNASEIRKPIVAGGCFSRADVKSMFDFGASAVVFDETILQLRPWRIRSLASYADAYGASCERSLRKRFVARLARAVKRDSPARRA